jgi:hypothetical protein
MMNFVVERMSMRGQAIAMRRSRSNGVCAS